MNGHPADHNEDAALVSAVLNGSDGAWHGFIERYSGLILGVIKRKLYEADEDQIRTLYVDVLSSLYSGALNNYQGKSSLNTWLIVFARNRACDWLRSTYGRKTEPAGFERLDERDRSVFVLFYVEMLPLEAILLQLRFADPKITPDDIVESVCRIEETLSPRYLNNLIERNQARMNGIKSVQLARYLVDLRVRDEIGTGSGKPDSELIHKETEKVLQALKERISELPENERKVLHLRFDRGLSARDIAEEMGINKQRQVYTIIDRAVHKLQKSMELE